MKKMRLLFATTLCCIMGFVGYITYEKVAMTDAEKFMLANVEALTLGETGSGTGTCGSYGWTGDSYAIICKVSKAEAMENYNWWNTPYKGWCCDSCGDTWYCGKKK